MKGLNLCGFLSIALVLLVCEQVLARYLFGEPSAAIYELSWHLFGFIFLLGVGPAIQKDRHVRVDIFYSKFKSEKKLLLNLLCFIFFITPTALLLIAYGWEDVKMARDFSQSSIVNADPSLLTSLKDFFLKGEASADPGGLPARWIIKAAIPLSGVMMLFSSLVALKSSFKDIKRSKND